jgi:hypothetical protein
MLCNQRSVDLAVLLRAFKAMEAAEATAAYVYKRVLERYPHNGKLLKVRTAAHACR